MEHPYRNMPSSPIRDKRLEAAIIDGENERKRKLQEDRESIMKWVDHDVFDLVRKRTVDNSKCITVQSIETLNRLLPHDERMKLACDLVNKIKGLKAQYRDRNTDATYFGQSYLYIYW